MKTYDTLIAVLMIAPDYAVSHALNALFIKYVKHRELEYHFNFGEFRNMLIFCDFVRFNKFPFHFQTTSIRQLNLFRIRFRTQAIQTFWT